VQQIYLFDFDGVISDSRKELYNTSLNSYLKFLKKNKVEFNRKYFNKIKLYDEFLVNVDLAHSSSDFYILWNKIFIEKNIFLTEPLSNKNLKLKYKEEFYKYRKKIKQENINKWIKYHKINRKIKNYINNYKNSKNIYIVSAKDKSSLKLLKKEYNINIRDENLISTSKYESKKKVFQKIAKKYKKHKINLIEDSIENIKIGNKLNFCCYYATWYKYSSINKNDKFSSITITDLKKILV
tara:strand:+ start:48 stop:764 length:717 start_codon:yes stop_codon:yes gene_type:complete